MSLSKNFVKSRLGNNRMAYRSKTIGTTNEFQRFRLFIAFFSIVLA